MELIKSTFTYIIMFDPQQPCKSGTRCVIIPFYSLREVKCLVQCHRATRHQPVLPTAFWVQSVSGQGGFVKGKKRQGCLSQEMASLDSMGFRKKIVNPKRGQEPGFCPVGMTTKDSSNSTRKKERIQLKNGSQTLKWLASHRDVLVTNKAGEEDCTSYVRRE